MLEMPEGWSPYNREHTKQIREAATSEAAYQDGMNRLWNGIHNQDALGEEPVWWNEDEIVDWGADPEYPEGLLSWDEDEDEDEDSWGEL
jgi:hypothetical protein